MEHYVDTGEVLGKGTENLEGYSIAGKGHFGPGRLPQFSREFFEFPSGREEDWLFDRFKEKLSETGVPGESELAEFANDVKIFVHPVENVRNERLDVVGQQGAVAARHHVE